MKTRSGAVGMIRSALAQMQRTIDFAPDYIKKNPKRGVGDILRALEASLEYAESALQHFSDPGEDANSG
jgi:hypothetical protein